MTKYKVRMTVEFEQEFRSEASQYEVMHKVHDEVKDALETHERYEVEIESISVGRT